MGWQLDLALLALALASGWMAWEDWAHLRFPSPLYGLAVLACIPLATTLGWFGWLLLGYSLAMVAVGLALARAGVWGSGDALALGVVGLQPVVFLLSAACAALGVALYRLARGPRPSRFAAFWSLADGRPVGRDRLPYATALGLPAVAFLALEALAGG